MYMYTNKMTHINSMSSRIYNTKQVVVDKMCCLFLIVHSFTQLHIFFSLLPGLPFHPFISCYEVMFWIFFSFKYIRGIVFSLNICKVVMK